ncbi:alpha/beta hydrolase family protein [Duganella lactea]|uniref:alpha/beta hydrolase family protein n=1 Tax=Duganella lactea TaxID=2692173 RepID=UPI0019260015
MLTTFRALACVVFALVSQTAWSQSVTAADTRLMISLSGKQYDLAARVYRPDGPGHGPFPLIVVNHGTPTDRRKLPQARLSFARAAKWFAGHGYMVVVALRPGFGSSSGAYLEASGRCGNEDFVAAGRRTAAIESAIVTAASHLPGADPERIVVIGQSAGGFGAITLGGTPPSGVRGIISFAGGRGSNGKERICAGEDKLIAAERELGAANSLPQLWLYADNDHYFRKDLARRMFGAFADASRAPVTFVPLPAFGDNGHATFAKADPQVWAEPVAAFLTQVLKDK